MKPASLLQWYEHLRAEDVVAMVGSAQENHQLEFKTLRTEALDKDDRKNVARALSGFANAAGGVVIWGVEARKGSSEDPTDQVAAAPGLSNAALVLSRFLDLTGRATGPGVVGAEHRLIEGAGRWPDFVATYVPETLGLPVMALMGENRYYRRIGGSFVVMDHAMVADMFGRRARPELAVEFVPSARAGGPSVTVRVRNVGRGIARASYLMLRVVKPLVASRMSEYPLPLRSGAAGWNLYAHDYSGVLHPGVDIEFAALTEPHSGLREPLTTYAFDYRLGAADVQEVWGHVAIDFTNAVVTDHRRIEPGDA